MSPLKKVLFFFVLPMLGIMFYDPMALIKDTILIAILVVLLAALGVLLWRGYSTVLTFMIFLCGMNVIVRLMMLLSTAFNKAGEFQPKFMLFTLAGLAISFYLTLRLDKVDVRITMIR
jgi:hypothetical protein